MEIVGNILFQRSSVPAFQRSSVPAFQRSSVPAFQRSSVPAFRATFPVICNGGIEMRFEELEVWKRSARLSADVYKHFMGSRDFGFKDQITRSSLSVPSNIAEGYERFSNKDTIKFLYYSKGSCAELRTQIYIGMDIGYIEKDVGNLWVKETVEISKMLQGLISAFKIEN